MKKIKFVSPSEPAPNGKGYQVLLYNRIKCLANTYKCEIIIVPPITSIFYQKSLNYNLPNVILKKVTPSLLDFFFCIVKIFFLFPFQVAMHTRTNLDSLLQDGDLVYYVTSRCIQSHSSLKKNVVCDFVDSMFLNFSRKANSTHFIKRLLFNYEAEAMLKFEKKVCDFVSISICVSEIDKKYIGIKCQHIPLGVSLPTNLPPKNYTNKRIRDIHKIVFTGNLNYEPNLSAIFWFLRDILPKISEKYPTIQFSIVGRNASLKNIRLFQSINNVNFIGPVNDMFEEISKHDISVAPMISGSGMQFKILEAMSIGVPVVSTTLGVGAIKANHGSEILIGDTNEEFINCIIQLIEHDDLYKKLKVSAQRLIKINHSWDVINDRVKRILRKVN